nr:class I SAM-dependent methyltransferase [Parachlamydiaceae bacterium]
LINGDMTKFNLASQKFDLIICNDVLPYIDSADLQSFLQRIHDSLLPNGFFVGSFFCPFPETENDLEAMRKLGAHFYKEEIIPLILRDSGFTIKECSIRLGPNCMREGVQFIVAKSETADDAPFNSSHFINVEESKVSEGKD